jgi:hypothetical protein
MQVTIDVDTHPFDDEVKLYSIKQFTFEPGLTSLVGCNGSGKSTLIDCYLKPYLDKQKIPVIHYNDRISGGTHLMDAMLNSGDMSTLAGMAFASEGERIVFGLDPIFGMLKSIFTQHKGQQVFIILDACDSGMSIDEIAQIKETFLDVVITDAKETYNVELYIVVAANNYEWCNDSRIHNMDITSGKSLSINSYEEYRQIILKSRKLKDKLRS